MEVERGGVKRKLAEGLHSQRDCDGDLTYNDAGRAMSDMERGVIPAILGTTPKAVASRPQNFLLKSFVQSKSFWLRVRAHGATFETERIFHSLFCANLVPAQ